MKKKTITLGALEKSRKKKTMALKMRPRRRRWLWELGKNHEEQDHDFEVLAKKKKTIAMEFWKTRKKKTMALGALEKTMKKKSTILRFRLGRRRP